MSDGVYGMLPREKMEPHVRKYWDFMTLVPGAPLFQQEFGFFTLERWRREEGLPENADLSALFGYDNPASVSLGGLGGCEAPFEPKFTEAVLEDRGDYELVRDFAGRSVLCFKNRRNGFMPEYVDHPVKDMRTWEENCKWRLNPNSPERQAAMNEYLPRAVALAQRGYMVEQYLVGGYMYLRSLMGPEGLLFMFYDAPELIHDCMQVWFALADNIIARHQRTVSIDLLLFDEDICYNHGPLISPDMIREFLLPYYQQLVWNARKRQLDGTRTLYMHAASDGFFDPVIDLYREAGMRCLSPFEVASGSDVVRTGMAYPDLLITGGIDKRVLAGSIEGIDRMADSILPAMRARGGYVPTCDHGVPEEVPLNNYLHYRRRCLEFG